MYFIKERVDKRINVLVIQVSLLLEYCSKGDLKSFLVDHRKEFHDSLNEFYKTGFTNKSIPKSSANQILDIRILLRWVFQVKIFKLQFIYVLTEMKFHAWEFFRLNP